MLDENNQGKPTFVDYLGRIEVILIPGHSTGFQGVSVQTERGKYFIAGDAVGLFEC